MLLNYLYVLYIEYVLIQLNSMMGNDKEFLLLNQLMLQRNKDKQNINKAQGGKSGNMLYKAIEVLKQDKQNLIRENEQREKFQQQQKRKLKQEIQGYKRKIAELTEANILHNLVQKQTTTSKIDNQTATKIRRVELELEHSRKIISERQKAIDCQKSQIKQLEKRCRLLHQQKQKHLQVSLTEKISLEEKIELLQKEVGSKKKLIDGLKRQLDKANKAEFQLSKKERQIVKRGREMNKYEEEFQSYYSENQKKYQRKIQNLQEENKFLRKQIKKIAKKLKATCQCQGEAQQWKQQLYRVGRQLAKARVELGKAEITKAGSNAQTIKKVKQGRQQNFQSDDNDQSIGSLTLSQESQKDETYRSTEKK